MDAGGEGSLDFSPEAISPKFRREGSRCDRRHSSSLDRLGIPTDEEARAQPESKALPQPAPSSTMTDASPSLDPPLAKKKYFAFVSYSSKDKRWGRWLHRRLENYVIPRKVRALAAEQGRELPSRLRPCFRDRDELAGAADLGEKISKALRDTGYLVVLCSKRSARSEWVNKEIKDFRALDPENKDRILALILDGVPNATSDPAVDDAEECLPPALRLPLEPLAGDLRPEGDGRGRGFIKILAGLTGMDFDQFYRRHERREQQIRAAWTTVAVSLILGFAGLAAFALLQRQEAIRQRDLAVARAEMIKENVDWMNFELRDILGKYAPSGVAVEANERIDTMLEAVETGNGEGMPKTWLEIKWDQVSSVLGVPTEAARPDLVVLRARSIANMQSADAILRNSEEDPAQALPLLESARQMAEELVKLDPANTQFRRDVSISYNKLGDVQMNLGDTAQALGYYEKALAVAEGVVRLDPVDTQFRSDVSSTYNRLGDVQMKLGDTAQALGFYGKALEVREELVQLDPANTQFRRDVSVSYNKLGYLQLQLGDTALALGFYEKALKVREELVQLDPANTQFRSDVSVSYSNLGDVQLQPGDTALALGFYEKALAVREELVKLDPANTQFRRDVSISYEKLGDVQLQLGDTAQALGFYEKALAVREELVKLDPVNTQFRRDVGVSYSNLGDVQLQLGDTAQALGFYEKALVVREELVQMDPANTDFRRGVFISYARLGLFAKQRGDVPEAIRRFEQMVAMMTELSQKDPANAQWLQDLANANEELARLRTAEPAARSRHGIGDTTRPNIFGLRTAEPAGREASSLVAQVEGLLRYNKLGGVQMKLGDTTQALGFYEKALAVAEELVMLDPANTLFRHDVSASYNKLGDVQMKLGDTAQALGYYEKALAIDEELVKLDPTNTLFRRGVFISYARLGLFAEQRGDLPEAIRRFEQMVAVMTELSQKDPANAKWRQDLANANEELARLRDAAKRK